MGEQRRARKVRNARLFARSRELSHRSVSILPSGRVFVERERGWRGRGEEKIEKKNEGHVSMQKHPAARISPLLIFPATFERSPLASSVSSFLSPLSSLLDSRKMADEGGGGGRANSPQRLVHSEFASHPFQHLW